MPRQRVIGLVAVHVHPQSALGSQLAQQLHAGRTFAHGAFKMRNAAHHVHAQIERALEVVQAPWGAQHAVLRKGDQLQVQVGRNAVFDLQHGAHRQQAGVAGVHVAADGQQAFGHRPVAVSQRTFDQRLLGQHRLEFAPERDPFEQRSTVVDARQSVAERRVHVKVRIAERRAQQLALGIHGFVRRCVQTGCHLDDAPPLNGDRHVATAIRQTGMGDQQVKHHGLLQQAMHRRLACVLLWGACRAPGAWQQPSAPAAQQQRPSGSPSRTGGNTWGAQACRQA